MPEPTITAFVSHSSADETLAFKLVELLRAALNLPSNEIRCTSVDGYRLQAGAHTETELRQEVNSAKLFIGLITPNSLSSDYVLFELGARWGAGLHLVPLLAGIEPQELRGPLTALNAIVSKSEPQLHQMVENLAGRLGISVQGVASYARYVTELAQLSRSASRSNDQPGVGRVTQNLIFTGAFVTPITQVGTNVWSSDMGRFERAFNLDHGEKALVARFTNEARRGIQNVGGPVKAHLIYRGSGRERRRIVGCWLNEPTDFAEFGVDGIQELLIALASGNEVSTCGKRRVSLDFGRDGIETDIEPLPPILGATVVIRLTNADSGDFLYEHEFRLGANPLTLDEL